MIYANKIYAIPDIAKRLHIKEEMIRILIDRGLAPTVKTCGVQFLKGSVVQNLIEMIKEFNKELKEGKLPGQEIKKDTINLGGINPDAYRI